MQNKGNKGKVKKSEVKCYDHNGTELNVNDSVMFAKGKMELEGVISILLPNNKLIMNSEQGSLTVNAIDTYYVP